MAPHEADEGAPYTVELPMKTPKFKSVFATRLHQQVRQQQKQHQQLERQHLEQIAKRSRADKLALQPSRRQLEAEHTIQPQQQQKKQPQTQTQAQLCNNNNNNNNGEQQQKELATTHKSTLGHSVEMQPAELRANRNEKVLQPFGLPLKSNSKTMQMQMQQQLNDHAIDNAPKQQQQQQQQQQQPAKARIPAIFLPQMENILPLISKLNGHPAVGNFTTSAATSSNSAGVTVHCDDMATHQAIIEVLAAEKIQMYTHQSHNHRGYRVVVKKLHHSIPCDWLRDKLSELGFVVRFVRTMKHRYTGTPLNVFEVELQPMTNGSHLKIHEINMIGNQL
ncbi:hypothetical protein AWZ03_015023, partial [Drosophila navojoa]